MDRTDEAIVSGAGFVRHVEGRWVFQPRTGPTQQHEPSPPQRDTDLEVHVRWAADASVPDPEGVWTTLSGRLDPHARELEATGADPGLSFFDFWEPAPVSRRPHLHPAPGPLTVTPAVHDVAQDLRELGALVNWKVMRAGNGADVVVASSADPDTVTSRLGPLLGARLEVVQCPWTSETFAAAGAELVDMVSRFPIVVQGNQVNGEGHTVHVVAVTFEPEELRHWASQWPAMLVEVRACLARRGA